MNVLLIPSFFPTAREPYRATYIYDYARSLSIEHDVTVVYPQQAGTPAAGADHFFKEEWLAPRVRFVNYSYSHLPKSWILSYLNSYRRVWRRIRREWKIDVIFAHIAMPAGQAAVMLGKLFNLPVILVEHFGPARDWLEWTAYPKRLQYGTIGYTYRRVDYLSTVSSSLGKEITELFGATVHGKLYNPVDCDLFRPPEVRPGPIEQRVLCVTRGHAKDSRKGVSNLLAAWETVNARAGGRARLDIVGERVEELAEQIESRGIARSCRLHPWVPPRELARLMQAAALVVISSSYETFGRSGVEALACGVPVVATRCGGPEEYVEEGNGLLVPADDPEALAEGMLAGLNRENFSPPEAMSRRARDRFGYEAICRRFTEVAAGLTNGGARC
jgi:glycosyltransferase involved in cell wall biosynthesis